MDLLPVEIEDSIGHEHLPAVGAGLRNVVVAIADGEEVVKPKGQVLCRLVFGHCAVEGDLGDTEQQVRKSDDRKARSEDNSLVRLWFVDFVKSLRQVETSVAGSAVV